jgi:hypothetical protein
VNSERNPINSTVIAALPRYASRAQPKARRRLPCSLPTRTARRAATSPPHADGQAAASLPTRTSGAAPSGRYSQARGRVSAHSRRRRAGRARRCGAGAGRAARRPARAQAGALLWVTRRPADSTAGAQHSLQTR